MSVEVCPYERRIPAIDAPCPTCGQTPTACIMLMEFDYDHTAPKAPVIEPDRCVAMLLEPCGHEVSGFTARDDDPPARYFLPTTT